MHTHTLCARLVLHLTVCVSCRKGPRMEQLKHNGTQELTYSAMQRLHDYVRNAHISGMLCRFS